MLAMGADVVRAEVPGYDETEALAREEAARSGRPFLSAFDDEAIMAGNGGTLAVEVLQDAPAARTFVLPVGGGGLAAGFAFYAREEIPEARIVGCQHELSPALKLSLEKGEAVLTLPPDRDRGCRDRRRDGTPSLRGPAHRAPTRSRCVSEEEILEAVRWMLHEHQYLVEPSAAVTVAACLTGKAGKLGGPTVVVLSGRNVSLETLRRILN